MLKLERTLPVTFGEISKVLPVVRVIATKKLHSPLARGVGAPVGLLRSETVEITFRTMAGEFDSVFAGKTMADSVPKAWIRFEPHTVEAMMERSEPEFALAAASSLITFMLLRVPVDALDFDDEWEEDTEHSYSRDGVVAIAAKPKPRLLERQW